MTKEKDLNHNESGHDNEGFTKYTIKENVQINERAEDRSYADHSKEDPTPISEPAAATTVGKTDHKEEVDVSCGVWKLRTNRFGRKFSNLYVFSIFVGLSTFFTLMVSSIFHIQITSLQRQFKIDNAEAGLFTTAGRIGSICTILFAGHFAKKVHIPMVVGLAGVIQGVVLMVPAFLQFADPYRLPVVTSGNNIDNHTNGTNKENNQYLCRTSEIFPNVTNGTNGTSSHFQSKQEETNHVAFVIIVVVQALKGVTDAFHAGFLPALYIDDNMIDKTKMGIFFGINSIITELANPIGGQINGFLSIVPIDLKPTPLGPKDSRFVAAWWLSFLAFGAGTVIFSIPVMLFPRKLLTQRQQEDALKKAMVSFTTGVMVTDDPSTGETNDNKGEKTPRASTKRENSPRPERRFGKLSLAPRMSNNSGTVDTTNHVTRKRSSLLPPVHGPSERRISIDGTIIFEQPIGQKDSVKRVLSIQGSSSLKELIKDFPKAFIRVFRRPVFILIIIDIFVASIPMAGLAMFRSAYITNEYNVPMSEVATLSSVTQIVGQLLGTVVSGFLANRVRTKVGYNYIIVVTYFISMCVTPLYFVFGCNNENVYGHKGDFGMPANMTDHCSCGATRHLLSCGSDGNNYLSPCYAGCESFHGNVFTACSGLGDLTKNVTLTTGICSTNCRDNFLLYVILHAVQMLLMSMSTIPRRLLILRLVDPTDRGFATSIFAFCSTLVAIPSPNLFGSVIDDTCLIWDGRYCSLYDRDKIRYLLSGVDIGVTAFLQFSMLIIIFFFRLEEKQLKKKILEEQNRTEESASNVKL